MVSTCAAAATKSAVNAAVWRIHRKVVKLLQGVHGFQPGSRWKHREGLGQRDVGVQLL